MTEFSALDEKAKIQWIAEAMGEIDDRLNSVDAKLVEIEKTIEAVNGLVQRHTSLLLNHHHSPSGKVSVELKEEDE
jgi:hypothetical protein